MAGIHLEDQIFPKKCGHMEGKALIPLEEMAGKIRAACEAREDPDFVDHRAHRQPRGGGRGGGGAPGAAPTPRPAPT